MDHKVECNSVLNTYQANVLKQYVKRQNVASHCLLKKYFLLYRDLSRLTHSTGGQFAKYQFTTAKPE